MNRLHVCVQLTCKTGAEPNGNVGDAGLAAIKSAKVMWLSSKGMLPMRNAVRIT